MQTGAQQFVFADDTVLAYVRAADVTSGCEGGRAKDRVLVVMNKAKEARAITVAMKGTALEGCSRMDDDVSRGCGGCSREPRIAGSGSPKYGICGIRGAVKQRVSESAS